jgi:hypothetical protein
MEMTRQKFEEHVHQDAKGGITVVGERAVGPVETFEFGGGDDITRVVRSGYFSNWNPDFLKKELGEEGKCARFYFDKKVAVDIGDPESKTIRRKRKLLFRNGFGYLCIPVNFTHDEERMNALYRAAISEYYAYEKMHPRPVVTQEALITDAQGIMHKANLTAIDIKVGVGIVGSAVQQKQELQAALKTRLSKKEVRIMKRQRMLQLALRRCAENGQPFRNPFIGPNGKRLFRVHYAQ